MNRGQILVLPVDQQFFIVGKVLDLVQTELLNAAWNVSVSLQISRNSLSARCISSAWLVGVSNSQRGLSAKPCTSCSRNRR